MSIENFNKAVSIRMINRRYFAIYDKLDVDKYLKEKELVRQAVNALRKLYEIAEPDVQTQQKEWAMGDYFEKRYNFKI